MELKTDYDDIGRLVITAKITHHEKDLLFKLINDTIWIENPDNDARPVDED